MRRYIITQRDSTGSFLTVTTWDTYELPPVVRTDGKLYGIDINSIAVKDEYSTTVDYVEIDIDAVQEL